MTRCGVEEECGTDGMERVDAERCGGSGKKVLMSCVQGTIIVCMLYCTTM